jgi:teichuronic acid biosynthesis glycosyltransferase TuaC
VIPRMDILAAVSAALAEQMPRGLGLTGRAHGPAGGAHVQVLPCGVALERFHPIPRAHARAELGLDPERSFLLFAADPSRPEKRYDRALELAQTTRVPYWINASNAVLVPSEREGFGLAVLEALACDVPVLATPVGVHPEALGDVAGTLCAPFALDTWREALAPHMRDTDPHIAGRGRAESFSAQRMAERVAAAWSAALARAG